MSSGSDITRWLKEKAPRAHKPKLCLHMQMPPGSRLPPGYRRRPAESSPAKFVTLKGLWLIIESLPQKDVENEVQAVLGPSRSWTDRSVTTVAFGPVTGRKFILKGESSRGPYKRLVYALTVPGGHVYVSIIAIRKKAINNPAWDETPFEACFHTLRVETELPPSSNPQPSTITQPPP